MSKTNDRTVSRPLGTHWAEGGLVKRAIPSNEIDYNQVDPFLLLDIFDASMLPAGKIRSFSEHPHRGFEIITYRLSGPDMKQVVTNDDGSKTAITGALMRVTTGRGMSHGEEATKEKGKEHLKGLQLWINLAKKDKKLPFDYQALKAEEIPVAEKAGYKVRFLVGGDSPVHLRTPAIYLDVTVLPAATFSWDIPQDYQGFVYVLSGVGKVGSNDVEVKEGQFLVLGPGQRLQATASSELRFVLAAGRPHREPVRWNGPFVD